METEPRYQVCVNWNGAADDPADNEFNSFDEALEIYNDLVEDARYYIEKFKRRGESVTAEISIYDTFECQDKERWSSDDL